MSKVWKQISNAGRIQKVRRNFRGRGKGRASLEVSITMPTKGFVSHVLRREKYWLNYTGRSSLRQYRKMHSRKYPKQLTKKLDITKRYKREIEMPMQGDQSQARKYPYTHEEGGYRLRKYSRYAVNEDRGHVQAGPVFWPKGKLKGSNKDTVPQLLNEGGTARVVAPTFRKIKLYDSRAGRYKQGTAESGNRNLRKQQLKQYELQNEAGEALYAYVRDGSKHITAKYRSFNWTVDLRQFGIKVMRNVMKRDQIGG